MTTSQAAFLVAEQFHQRCDAGRADDPIRILRVLLQAILDAGHAGGQGVLDMTITEQ